MKKKTILSIFLLLVVSSLLLAACGGGTPEETEEPVSQENQINLIYTQAAETLQAEIALTEAAKPLPTSTSLSSPTPVFIATNTPITPAESPTPFPTLPALPSPTPFPTKAAAVAGRPCLRAELMFESFPDGSKLSPGQSFVKEWRFANAGDCTWNENFGLIHVGELNLSDLGSYNLLDVSNMTSAEEGALSSSDVTRFSQDLTALLLANSGDLDRNPPEWLTIAHPQLILLSVDTYNRSGHPDQELLTVLEGYPHYRTDHNGSIKLVTDGHQFWIYTKRK